MTRPRPEGAHAVTTGDELDFFRALLDQEDDLLFSVSCPDFKVTWANAAALAYFETVRGATDPIGKTPAQLAYNAERAAIFERLFERAVADGSAEADYRSAADDRLWHLRVRAITREGQCIGLIVNGKDFTEEASASQRALHSERMYRSLFRCMGVGAVFQAPDGRIIAVNQAAELIEGRSEAQMMGLTSDASDWDAVKADGSPFPGCEHPSMVTLRTGKPQSDVVMGIRRPNGERRWILINSEPVIGDDDSLPRAVVATFHDITEQRKLQEDLAASVKLLSRITQHVPGVVYQFALSPEGKASVPYASEHAWDLMELRPSELRDDAQALFDRVHPDDLAGFKDSIRKSAELLTTWRHEFRVILPSTGEVLWLAGEAEPDRREDGGVIWYGLTRDISETKAHEAYLFRLGHFDDDTGLPNRRYLTDRLNAAIRALRATGGAGAFIQIDLDDFNQVNDVYGHGAGDQILAVLAQRLDAELVPECFLARFGGDEFAVLYQSTASTPEDCRRIAHALVDRIRHRVGQPVELDHIVYTPRCSVGIALFSSASADAADIMREADTALYRAKRSGGGGTMAFEETMLAEARSKLLLSQALDAALDAGQIQVQVQSQFDARRRVTGGELLLRWQHPQHGWVPPSVFIPLAEETGIIQRIGDFVLRQACAVLQRLQEKPKLSISVNVSPVQFMAADFVSKVAGIMAEYAIDPRRLTLEVTESLLIQDKGAAREKMQELSRLGLVLSIDDFGTGYSSLAYLKDLPIAELKIDQSFVHGIPASRGDVAIVQAVLSIARYLDLRVVAEGVENERQFDFLIANGCPLIQGFGLAWPLPLELWLSEQLHRV